MHELRHVFVMTYGRSGSTLLMGILNSIPGWLLRGENRHAMRHLYDFHRSGLTERARVDPARASQPTHPWFGIEAFPEAASLQHIRSLRPRTMPMKVWQRRSSFSTSQANPTWVLGRSATGR